MIDLKQKVADIINREYESNKISLLEHDWSDSIYYYQADIVKDFQEYIGRKLNIHELERIIDYLIDNQDNLLEYQECGFPYAVPDTFGITSSVGEFEIQLDSYFPHMTEGIAKTINHYTDLYIADDLEYGYISCGYDYLSIRNDNNTLITSLLELFG